MIIKKGHNSHNFPKPKDNIYINICLFPLTDKSKPTDTVTYHRGPSKQAKIPISEAGTNQLVAFLTLF